MNEIYITGKAISNLRKRNQEIRSATRATRNYPFSYHLKKAEEAAWSGKSVLPETISLLKEGAQNAETLKLLEYNLEELKSLQKQGTES